MGYFYISEEDQFWRKITINSTMPNFCTNSINCAKLNIYIDVENMELIQIGSGTNANFQ